MKGATVVRVAGAVASILGIDKYETKITGLRCTEKIHEVLDSNHRACLRSDTCPQYTDAELRDLLEDTVLELAGVRKTRRRLKMVSRETTGGVA